VTHGVTVRTAGIRDLDDVVALRLALLREYPTHPVYGRLRADAEDRARELYASQLRGRDEAMFLADAEDARAIGILRCIEVASAPFLEPVRYGYVSSTYVRPAHRRQGVLQLLLAAAESWCRERALDEIRLHHVGGGTAERAWSALGFEAIEVVRRRAIV